MRWFCRPLPLALLLGTATVATLLLLFVQANFGLPPAALWSLLLLPLTLGLPTTLGVLLVVWLWSGPPLWLLAAAAALTGMLLQFLSHRALRALWRRRR